MSVIIETQSAEQKETMRNSGDSPYARIYNQLVSEGIEWYATLHQQPDGASEEDIDNWSSYFFLVTQHYNSLVGDDRKTIVFEPSPTVIRLQESSPRFVRMLLEDAHQIRPIPDDLQNSLQEDPTGITWIQKQLTPDDKDNEGALRIITRAAALYNEPQ